jgi:hypothetical protein
MDRCCGCPRGHAGPVIRLSSNGPEVERCDSVMHPIQLIPAIGPALALPGLLTSVARLSVTLPPFVLFKGSSSTPHSPPGPAARCSSY